MLRRSSALVLGLTGLAAALAPASAQTAAPDPYAIFSSARHYWQNQHCPARLAYTITVDVLEGGAHKVEHYTSAYDAVNDEVAIDALSDYEIAHPASGRGLNFGIRSSS